MTIEPEYYTPDELSALLSVPLETIRYKTKRNQVPGQIKIWGRWRYRRIDVIRELQKHEFGAH